MKPYVGAVVVIGGGRDQKAAIVTKVHEDDAVDLCWVGHTTTQTSHWASLVPLERVPRREPGNEKLTTWDWPDGHHVATGHGDPDDLCLARTPEKDETGHWVQGYPWDDRAPLLCALPSGHEGPHAWEGLCCDRGSAREFVRQVLAACGYEIEWVHCNGGPGGHEEPRIRPSHQHNEERHHHHHHHGTKKLPDGWHEPQGFREDLWREGRIVAQVWAHGTGSMAYGWSATATGKFGWAATPEDAKLQAWTNVPAAPRAVCR